MEAVHEWTPRVYVKVCVLCGEVIDLRQKFEAENGGFAHSKCIAREPQSHLPADRKTLLTYRGLGDCLLTLAAAYSLAEESPGVSIIDDGGKSLSQGLPVFPLLSSEHTTNIMDCRIGPEFFLAGNAGANHVKQIAGVQRKRSTPDMAILQDPPGMEEIVQRLAGVGPYAILSPEGISSANCKRLSEAQQKVIADECAENDLRVIGVGNKPLHFPAGIVNLSGLTTLTELCAIMSRASLCVTAETGTAHLAAAYCIPTVVLHSARTMNPAGLSESHQPFLWVSAGDAEAGTIPERQIRDAIPRMIAATRTKTVVAIPDRKTCGVADWGERLAEAMGIECRPLTDDFSDADAVVCQYHPYDLQQWREFAARYPGKSLVCDLHHIDHARTVSWASTIYHTRQFDGCNDGSWHYLPLATWEPEELPLPARPSRVGWQGIIHSCKRLPELVAAIRKVRDVRPDATLRICGSTSKHSEPSLVDWLREQEGDGVEVIIREKWTNAQFSETLRECDLYCYPELIDGEQSAASTCALAFGKPVMVSESTKHDDVRPWCINVGKDLAETLLRIMVDIPAYHAAALRARQGASYRAPAIIARQYRALVTRAILERQAQS